MIKKMMAMLMSLMLVFTLFGLPVFAADVNTGGGVSFRVNDDDEDEEDEEVATVKKGDTFVKDGIKYEVTKTYEVAEEDEDWDDEDTDPEDTSEADTTTYGEVCIIKVKNAKSVKIPSSVDYNDVECYVTAIGNNAFEKLSKLTKITGGDHLTTIGKSAFANCKKLKSISISSTLIKKIAPNCLTGDSALKSITVKTATAKKLFVKAAKKAGLDKKIVKKK